jgi:hypothetical protein
MKRFLLSTIGLIGIAAPAGAGVSTHEKKKPAGQGRPPRSTLSDFHQSSQTNFSDWPQRTQRKIRKVGSPSRTSEFARSILLS